MDACLMRITYCRCAQVSTPPELCRNLFSTFLRHPDTDTAGGDKAVTRQTVNNNVVERVGETAAQEADTRVPFKEISAYLTLLQGGKPEDKLECESHLLFNTSHGGGGQCQHTTHIGPLLICSFIFFNHYYYHDHVL